MTTLFNLSYTPSDESVIQQLIALPFPADADLFEAAEHCAALVSVLVETDNWRREINGRCKILSTSQN
ncbi:hypothetical protein [Leclercia sp.]|uniref:hypothetical protein n=1 Tax=Leclercia sp. TaxID=1898428 RepID=UPI0028A06CD1|nr:hypothetical protein [Leclercia sp.]